mmetsp:Transcript_21268/g.49295  ORF Transcript_21268/g.49295 Transcript_21268/m.49295 type:complete len:570 (+) Transcript_21268:217-1926(+)
MMNMFPANRSPRSVWVALLAIALFARAADAQCYLEDANAECSVCWFTVYGSADDTVGVTKMKPCPPEIKVTWDTPLPEEMTEFVDYEAKYKLSVSDQAKYPIIKKQDKKSGSMNHVPHANIHSCIASRGACTPFVANSPGLATHTPAVMGNVAADGTQVFSSDVQLTRDQYTIIAHVRFFTPNEEDPSLPDTKVDAAIGVSREVLQQVAEVSADSYISTAVIGALILCVFGGLVWAFRKGVINLDKVLEAVYSDEVTLPMDIITGLGDVSAFTVSVFTIILYDPNTVQVVPAAILFLVFAWLGSFYNAYHDIRQMWSVYMLKNHRRAFTEMLAQKLVDKTVKQARRLSTEMEKEALETPNGITRRVSIAGNIVEADTDHQELSAHFSAHVKQQAAEEHKFNVMLDLEIAQRDIRRKRGDVVTIITESIPITAIQFYVLLNAEEVAAITAITLLFAAIVLGAKASGLGMYQTARIKRDQCEERFHDVFDVVMPEGSAKFKRDVESGNASNKVVPISTPMNKVQSPLMAAGSSPMASPDGPQRISETRVLSQSPPAQSVPAPGIAASVPLE